jgi:hypothetical protein
MDADAPTQPQTTANPAGRKRWLIPVAALAAVLLLAAVAAFVAWRSSQPSDTEQAIAACREGVKAKLRAPASALFSGETVDPQRDGTHIVEGSVDGQNGFGALIRSRYDCRVKKLPNGQWGPPVANIDG